MKLFKKLATYFSMVTLVLSGTSFKSIASEGDEDDEEIKSSDTKKPMTRRDFILIFKPQIT